MWLAQLADQFADCVLDVDEPVVEAWARLRVIRPLPAIDGLIAATAVAHDLTLVTGDTRDFKGLNVRLLDPFEAS